MAGLNNPNLQQFALKGPARVVPYTTPMYNTRQYHVTEAVGARPGALHSSGPTGTVPPVEQRNLFYGPKWRSHAPGHYMTTGIDINPWPGQPL